MITRHGILALLLTIGAGVSFGSEDPADTPPPGITLSELAAGATGKTVCDHALIVEVAPPDEDHPGIYKIYLQYGKGKIPLVILPKIWENIPFAADLKPGVMLFFRAETLDASGDVAKSLFVYEASQLSLTAVPKTKKEEKVVTREGKFRSIRATEGGVVIEIMADDGLARVFAPFSVSSKLPLAKFSEDSVLKITGRQQPPGKDTELVLERVEDCVIGKP